MGDLSLLYYTSNTIQESTRKKIADYLIEVTENKYPIVSVSQKPIDLGHNICVGDIGANKFNAYKQIHIGSLEIKTKYVACVDDDTLYAPEHFLYRPEKGFFSHEINYWFAQPAVEYYWRVNDIKKRGGMWGCISETKLLADNLTQRFKVFPTHESVPEGIHWGEPGMHDGHYGMENKLLNHSSKNPCVVFVHPRSMGYTQLRRFYRRYGYPLPEDKRKTLKQFGGIKELFIKYFGE